MAYTRKRVHPDYLRISTCSLAAMALWIACQTPAAPLQGAEATFSATTFGARTHLVVVDEDASDGVNRIAVHYLEPTNGRYRLILVDPWAGPVAEWKLPGTDEASLALTAEEVTGDTNADPILLNRNLLNGMPVVHVIDGADGSPLRRQTFFDTGWNPVDVVAYPDPDDDSVTHAAVLAAHGTTGEIAVQVREALTGAWVRNLFFFGPTWTPMQLLAIDEFDGNPGRELGVLAVGQDGRIAVMIRDAGTSTFVRNLFYFDADWDPVNAVVLSPRPTGTAPELAVLARNRATAQAVVMIRDAGTGTFLNNVFPFGGLDDFEPLEVFADGDANGNGATDLATVAQTEATGDYICLTKDSMTGVIRTRGCAVIEPYEWSAGVPPDWLDSLAWVQSGVIVESSLFHDGQLGARLKTCRPPGNTCNTVFLSFR